MKDLKKIADKWFSMYIRLRDSNDQGYVRCCTCGKMMFWKEADCGHYLSRRHSTMRFEDTNCAPQCVECNRMKHGEPKKFRDYLISKYGRDQVMLIEHMKNDEMKWDDISLNYLIGWCKTGVEEMKAKKGL